VSLAGALQEYLEDPNFDQNRIEYRANKEAADRNKKSSVNSRPKKPEACTCYCPSRSPYAVFMSYNTQPRF
jgi:hypothetical protein